MEASNRDIKKICFFCSEIIEDKKSLEHIIPDSLLGKLGIKQDILDTFGKSEFLYSKVKVPAHRKCNNTFGSDYENKVLKLLENPSKLFEDLKNEEGVISDRYSPNNSITLIISTWLSKIFYGLFYHEFLKTNNERTKELAFRIIQTRNFNLIREAYKDGVGFCLPSSLFVFESSESYFDLKTIIQPQTIMMKIDKLIFVLCIGDGFLIKNYLTEEILKELRNFLVNQEKSKRGFPIHLFALAEITSIRINIPRTPTFIYNNNEIVNMSFFTLAENPEKHFHIDNERIMRTRNQLIEKLINRNNP